MELQQHKVSNVISWLSIFASIALSTLTRLFLCSPSTIFFSGEYWVLVNNYKTSHHFSQVFGQITGGIKIAGDPVSNFSYVGSFSTRASFFLVKFNLVNCVGLFMQYTLFMLRFCFTVCVFFFVFLHTFQLAYFTCTMFEFFAVKTWDLLCWTMEIGVQLSLPQILPSVRFCSDIWLFILLWTGCCIWVLRFC